MFSYPIFSPWARMAQKLTTPHSSANVTLVQPLNYSVTSEVVSCFHSCSTQSVVRWWKFSAQAPHSGSQNKSPSSFNGPQPTALSPLTPSPVSASLSSLQASQTHLFIVHSAWSFLPPPISTQCFHHLLLDFAQMSSSLGGLLQNTVGSF